MTRLVAPAFGIAPTFVPYYLDRGYTVVRTPALPAGTLIAANTTVDERQSPYDPQRDGYLSRDGLIPRRATFPVYSGEGMTKRVQWRARVLYVGDANRYTDPLVERIRRQAIALAVRTVRDGLDAYRAPGDHRAAAIADLRRPTSPGPARQD